MNFDLELPYGMRVFENGRIEIFNRRYERIRVKNPFIKEKKGVQFYEVWFYDDATCPKKSPKTEMFLREFLVRWDLGTPPQVKRWSV